MNKPKTKKCKICGKPFTLFLSTQKICSVNCAVALANINLKKKEELMWREKKTKLNDTIPAWTKKAQKSFNEFIRLRDYSKPCVSCGRFEHELTTNSVRGGVWDCGHYRSVGACPELRFEPLNAHKQCKLCNSHKSGNHVEYRFGIVRRLSSDELKWLEGHHVPKRYRVEDLKQIQKEYSEKSKELKALHKLS